MCHKVDSEKKKREKLQIISISNDEQGTINMGCRAMLTTKSITERLTLPQQI